MYYFLDMHDNKLNFIQNISEETCIEVMQSYDSVKEVLRFFNMGKCVNDALDSLLVWNKEANPSSIYLMRNTHTAERLVRGFLFELRTCLDYMEAYIKDEYGTDSDFWRIFQQSTNEAYDKHPEYAFTYHLRNCAQHCRNVVHGFNGSIGIGVSSNTERLLREYKKWKPIDKKFLADSGAEIDLPTTFIKAFDAFSEALRKIMNYLLNSNSVGKKVLFLRQWGDNLRSCFGHEVHCFHLVNLQFSGGKSAQIEDLKYDGVEINAYPLDWELIYELSASITPIQKSK